MTVNVIVFISAANALILVQHNNFYGYVIAADDDDKRWPTIVVLENDAIAIQYTTSYQ